MATTLTMAKAINMGLRKAMEEDPKVMLMGQDIGRLGGVYRVTDGLQAEFGDKRVVDTPLAEAGIVGTAIGLAMRGYRSVCEIQFDGFVFPAYDQIVSQVAKWRFRSQGRQSAPIVIRIPFGGGIGAVEHHSESPEALFAHVQGLRVVTCSNPQDAYWMIQQAIASPDPVIFFEPKRRYYERGDVDLDAASAPTPLQSSQVLRTGTDATIVAYGPMIPVALGAAELAAEEGRSLEIIDLRSIAPLDLEPIYASARKTGRVIVVHEATKTYGVGAEIAARVSENCFYHLEAPVLRVTGLEMLYPPARAEESFLPDVDRVLDGVDAALAY
jgi:Pyruvate/2-oxoglutarate dehydrogenase complex, dehydrogenase (E1) component, eukaryotic type, beta subunit